MPLLKGQPPDNPFSPAISLGNVTHFQCEATSAAAGRMTLLPWLLGSIVKDAGPDYLQKMCRFISAAFNKLSIISEGMGSQLRKLCTTYVVDNTSIFRPKKKILYLETDILLM